MAFENDPEGYRMAQGYAGHDFDKVRTVRREVMGEYSMEYSLKDFAALMAELLHGIPEEYRETAKVTMEDQGYDTGSKFEISYVGPEDEKTVAERVRRCEQYVAERRASERQTYESLKRKFG